MSTDRREKYSQCPCCKHCDECSDSKKVLAVLGTNLVIYRQRPHTQLNNNMESIKVKPEDTVILKNIDDKTLSISDCMSAQELQDIYCSRCKYIIEHANKMMLTGKIDKHLVIGVCSHCRQKSRPQIPCYECEDIAKKIIVSINEGSEDSKQKLKTWLAKVKHLLKDVRDNDESMNTKIPGIKYSELHISTKHGTMDKNLTVQQPSMIAKEKRSKKIEEAQVSKPKQDVNDIYRTRSVDSDLQKMSTKLERKDAIMKSDIKYDSKSDRIMSRGIHDFDSEYPLHKRDISRYNDTVALEICDYDSQYHSDKKFWPKTERLALSSNYLPDKKYDQKRDDDFHLQPVKKHVSKLERKTLLKAPEFDSDNFSDRKYGSEPDSKTRRAVREYDDHRQHKEKGQIDFLPLYGSLDKLIHKEYLKTTMPGLKIDEKMEDKKYAKRKQPKFVELYKGDKSVLKSPMYRSRSETSILDAVRTSVHSVFKSGTELCKGSKPKKDFFESHEYNEHLASSTLQRKKTDTKIDEHTTSSYTSPNKKNPFDESLSKQLLKPSEQLLRKDFSYQFPKETIIKKQPKRQRTSAELIKETQEMLNEREEEKKQKIEIERIKRRHDEEMRKQAREEKKRLQEEKKKEQEELKRMEERERIRAEEEKRRLEEDRKKEEEKQKALEDKIRKEEEKLSAKDDKRKKARDLSKIKEQSEEDKQRRILEKERAKEEKERLKEERVRAKEEKERAKEEKERAKAEKEKEKAEREKEKQDKNKTGDEKRHMKENTQEKSKSEKRDKEKEQADKEAEKLKKEKEKEIQLRMQREEKLREKDRHKIESESRDQKEQKKKEEEEKKKQTAEEQKISGKDEKTSEKADQKDKTVKKKKEIKKNEKLEEQIAKADSDKEPTIKELNLKQIKIRNPSYDDLILRLVKLKQSEPRGTTKLEQIVLPQVAKQHTKHKYLRGSSCLMCFDSELELDVESILMKPNQVEPKFADIIIGKKILKYKPPLIEKGEQAVVPSLFQSTFNVESPIGMKNQKDFSNVEPEHISTIAVPPKSHKSAETEAPKGVIRYALSDRTFIDKGWTMLPTEKIVRKMNVYRMRPAQPEFDWFERNKNKKLLLYDTGEKLAEFDDNGRARIYYKNGRLALDYYDAEEVNAQQRFVVFSSGELDERGRSHPITILATFDYLGNGIVFDYGGKIRLKYNQTEGVVLDRGIGPVSHWKWHTLNDPPVLQKVMIDTQMAHKDPDIVKLGTLADDKSRPDNEEMLAIEFDNFIKEKSKKLTQTFKPFQIKMKALKINEHFSLKILDQATIYLIFRDSSANVKLNLGMILDHKEIVDTDTAEVGEVSNNLERFPARTDSLAGLQRSVAYAQRFERARLERERHLRPPEPCSSADQLTAAASRPLRPPLRTVPSAPTTTAGSCVCSRKPRSCNVYYDTRFI